MGIWDWLTRLQVFHHICMTFTMWQQRRPCWYWCLARHFLCLSPVFNYISSVKSGLNMADFSADCWFPYNVLYSAFHLSCKGLGPQRSSRIKRDDRTHQKNIHYHYISQYQSDDNHKYWRASPSAIQTNKYPSQNWKICIQVQIMLDKNASCPSPILLNK